MKRTNLGNPIPREAEVPYSEFCYQIEEKSYLPLPDDLPKISFSNVLTSRRSRRTYKAVSSQLLNSLLWHSARAVVVSPPDGSPRWQHRPTPSAGGRHPIDLLIFRPQETSHSVYLYDPIPHALAKLKIRSCHPVSKFLISIDQTVALEEATILWFGAQFDRTLSKYESGESLVWRDTGALITTISLVSESLSLNCCAVGVTGEPFISDILGSKEAVVGVGGVLVGER